jgi:hypothetical protein
MALGRHWAWHSALSADQANERTHQQDDGAFQQDRDFLNAIRHLLWSGWCWAQSHASDQEGFSGLPELSRPESPPSWREFPLKGWHVPDRDVTRTRMPCPYRPERAQEARKMIQAHLQKRLCQRSEGTSLVCSVCCASRRHRHG